MFQINCPGCGAKICRASEDSQIFVPLIKRHQPTPFRGKLVPLFFQTLFCNAPFVWEIT